MQIKNIGILHPGEMGSSIAASAQNGGNTVYWASEGRSAATRARAEKIGLRDAGSLAKLCSQCELILSVCPPHAAEDLAREVAGAGFHGLYLDANAISPARVRRMAQALADSGIHLVDGGIIGGPAWTPGATWLYLSGPRAAEVAACFSAGLAATRVIGDEIGQASALKMCFAAYTKGSTALLCAVIAAAERLGVRDDLYRQWGMGDAKAPERNELALRRVTAKAWRFAGEMDEIAATFQEAGLPEGFYLAAAEVYRRMAEFKDAPDVPGLTEVLAALLEPEK